MRNLFFVLVFIGAALQLHAQDHSLFSEGEWYKITTTNTRNVQELTYDALVGAGIDVESIDPDRMRLYMMPAGLLPEEPGSIEGYPVKEMAVRVTGNNDGSFDPQDALLFYAGRQWGWAFDDEDSLYRHYAHPYSREVNYFLRVDGQQAGKRIETIASPAAEPAQVITLADVISGSQGAGDINVLKKGRDFVHQEISDEPAVLTSPYQTSADQPARFVVSCVWQSDAEPTLTMYLNDQELETFQLSASQVAFSKKLFSVNNFQLEEGDQLKVVFDNDLNARAFVDYMAVQTTQPVTIPEQPVFLNQNQQHDEIVEYQLSSDFPVNVWDITDPLDVKAREMLADDPYRFRFEASNTRKFIAFNREQQTGVDILTSGSISPVNYQDLYALEPAEMVIITNSVLHPKAEELANFHTQNSGLSVQVVDIQDVYNNFSGGVIDFTAIRDFIKHIYDKSEGQLQYALLFGDASYRAEDDDFIVPSYQGIISETPQFVTAGDNYFGYVDDGEDFLEDETDMDVSIGRLPVGNTDEAEKVVQKIMNYVPPESMGDWKLDMGFIADDEDENLHMGRQEDLCHWFNLQSPVFNTGKVYLDNYPQENGDEGETSPEATAAIHEMIESGTFLLDYNGHSGAGQWAHESVFAVDDVMELENDFYPFIVSAGIGDFYDPDRQTLAEAFINNAHGAIGLLTTTNTIFMSQWLQIGDLFYSNMLSDENQRLGDIFKASVNADDHQEVKQRHIFIGDPALKFPYPEMEILTESINGTDVSQFNDTLMRDEEFHIMASVNDNSGLATNYSGQAQVRVFAPAHQELTLGDGGEPFSFTVTDSVIYETQADVADGFMEFDIALPGEYDFPPDSLKISYYASNDQHDAAGYFDGLMATSEPSGIDGAGRLAFKVYPTLVNNAVNIKAEEHLTDTRIELYGSNGSKVLQKMWPMQYGKMFSLDMASLPRGVYFLRLANPEGVMTKRLIKQ